MSLSKCEVMPRTSRQVSEQPFALTLIATGHFRLPGASRACFWIVGGSQGTRREPTQTPGVALHTERTPVQFIEPVTFSL